MAKKKMTKKSEPEEDFFAYLDREEEAPPPQKSPQAGVWPETVPILAAESFCKGQPIYGQKRDLGGWLDEIFAGKDRRQAANVLYELIEAETGQPLSIDEFCDRKETSTEDMAQMWLAMLRKLDYEV